MNSNIKFWFEYSFKIARTVQTSEMKGDSIDGRTIWQNIEQEVAGVNIMDLKYRPELRNIYINMDKLIRKYKMEESEMNPKYNHFFMQLKNLVEKKSNFEIKMNRVLQLAYNAGQLSIYIEQQKLPEDIIEFVESNNLLDLDTYISIKNQETINRLYLDNTPLDKIKENIHNLGGSSDYMKYLKYKAKYLKLRSKIL
jgi:hypothetical protein